MSNPQHEPTMEEILASIRKIISEDSAEPQTAQKTQDADVLELTQEVTEEAAPPPVPAAPPAPVPVAAAVIAAAPPAPPTDDIVFQPLEETPVSSPAPSPAPSSSDSIFSDKARKALSDAFTSIDAPAEEQKPANTSMPPVAPFEGRTLEAIFDQAVRATFDPVLQGWLDRNKDTVVERMKPVITQWLDEHFPAMLEDAVREELARARTRPKR